MHSLFGTFRGAVIATSKFILHPCKLKTANLQEILGTYPRRSICFTLSTSKMAESQEKKIKLQFKNPVVWIDLEMSGLNVEKEKIMELACLLTDGDLQNVQEGPELIIHQPDEILNNMDEWCTNQHGKTGLTKSSKESKITEADAEQQVIDFLAGNGIKPGQARLAGNTVYMDRLFLKKYMPRIDSYLHYRIIDVSSIKELCKYWYPKMFYNAPKKSEDHRAMVDIYNSLEELKYYRKTIFIPEGTE